MLRTEVLQHKVTRVSKILDGIAQSDRVAGAYLFIGPPGVGKKAAAENFSEQLKCAKQDRFAIAPAGTSLKIDQIRELQTWVRYGPTISRYLTVIVNGADAMTDEAAGAFLKTLEEPAPGVVFLLLAEREDKLPATIMSRCQRIMFAEATGAWQPNQELRPFYNDLKNVRRQGAAAALQFSDKLKKEKERIEELLYDLLHFARYELADTRAARIILDTVRYLKRKASFKLALDVMCLKIGERNV
ncbi:AAA family ATPase [Candidatus Margulisiibacteriota bacterium]